jgi:hypothetical protein
MAQIIMQNLSLRFRHLTPALSPIEAERENYRQSVGEFVTIRVKDFASFWGWIESVSIRVHPW